SVTTKDGTTITIRCTIRYCIKDISKLFNSISHPDMTLTGIVMSGMAEFVHNTNSDQIKPSDAEKYVSSLVMADDYGLGDLEVNITSWARVRTFRLIQDQSWMSEGLRMDYLGEVKKN